MSVVIPGIDKPKRCSACFAYVPQDEDLDWCGFDVWMDWIPPLEVPEDCPLRETVIEGVDVPKREEA